MSREIPSLTGLRGFLAVNVVLAHFVMVFSPAWITGETGLLTGWEQGWARFWFATPFFRLDMNYAVGGFFLLSSYVLCWGFYQKGGYPSLAAAAGKRYIRLTLPVLMAALLMDWLSPWLAIADLQQAQVAMVPGVELFYQTTWSWLGALRESLWSVYFGYVQNASYNPVFWTMQYELKGSLLLMAVLFFFGSWRYRWGVYTLLLLWAGHSQYLCFVLGLLFYEMRYSAGQLRPLRRWQQRRWLPWLFLGAGFFLAAYTPDAGSTVYGVLTRWQAHWGGNPQVFFHILGSGFLFWGFLQSGCWQKIFTHPLFVFLGRYSYAVYLTHLSMICTVSGHMFLFFQRGGYAHCGLLTFLASLPFFAAAAWLVERVSNRPAKYLANRFSNWFAARLVQAKRRLLSVRYFKALWSLLQDIVQNRALLWQLTRRELRQRYLGSYLGILWAFIQPTVTVLIFWFVFQVGFKSMPVDRFPFILWLISGMVPWFYVSDAVGSAAGAVLENAFLVKKMVFRVELLPVVKIAAALLVHTFFIGVLLLMFLAYGYHPTLYWLQLGYYLLAMSCLVLGISWLTSALTVFLRDVGQLVAMLLQFAFWATPIFWSWRMIPAQYQFFLRLNPFYYVIEGYRDALVYHVWFWEHPQLTVYFWLVTLAFLLGGAVVFRRLRPHFADVL